MPQAARTFRIFVSSTFEDLKEERNALQERVFPEIKQLCFAHGARFQAIDLRWGVSEEASLDQQAMNICLTEIGRCRATSPRPNFIVLLGDRYGWRPPPPQIPVDEFGRLRDRVAAGDDRSLLDEWYLRDDNAVPAEHCLKPRTGEFEDYDTWAPVEDRLRTILSAAVAGTELEQDARYGASATEQEIVDGALNVLDAKEHVFCFLRSITGLPEDDSARAFRDLDAAGIPDAEAGRRLARLKDALGEHLPGNVHRYEAGWTGSGASADHLDQLCDDVRTSLSRVILEELGRLEAEDELEKELTEHRRFGAGRAEHFVGRRDILDLIGDQLAAADAHPFVVYGPSGSGKSALMGRAAQEARDRHPGAQHVVRFIGATPDSVDGRALLRNLCREIARRYKQAQAPADEAELLDEATVPSDYQELVEDFGRRLTLASAERPLMIFIDALDQLSSAGGARGLAWLPAELPEHVRVVVSVLERESASAGPLDVLRAKLPERRLVELAPLSRDDGGALLDAWLADAGRTLTTGQRAEVLARFESEGLPLYLRLAFEEARRWRSSTPADETTLSPQGIPGILRDDLFARLAAPENHGELVVSRSLAYLAAAKNGLSEDELIEVLSARPEVLEDFQRRSPKSPKVERLPVVIWSRLYFDLEPYLNERSADGALLMSFYHRQLGEAIERDYLAGDVGRDRHRELAAYFASDRLQPLERRRNGDVAANLRRLSELPYQQTRGELWDDVYGTLTDFRFLEVKAANSGVVEAVDAEGNVTRTYTGAYLLQDDYALALERMPGGRGGGGGGKRRIIVTGTDFGDGLKLRCPHCNRATAFEDRWRGDAIECPQCGGPLKVNEFVVGRR